MDRYVYRSEADASEGDDDDQTVGETESGDLDKNISIKLTIVCKANAKIVLFNEQKCASILSP